MPLFARQPPDRADQGIEPRQTEGGSGFGARQRRCAAVHAVPDDHHLVARQALGLLEEGGESLRHHDHRVVHLVRQPLQKEEWVALPRAPRPELVGRVLGRDHRARSAQPAGERAVEVCDIHVRVHQVMAPAGHQCPQSQQTERIEVGAQSDRHDLGADRLEVPPQDRLAAQERHARAVAARVESAGQPQDRQLGAAREERGQDVQDPDEPVALPACRLRQRARHGRFQAERRREAHPRPPAASADRRPDSAPISERSTAKRWSQVLRRANSRRSTRRPGPSPRASSRAAANASAVAA